jgi:diaminopimelate epimerase
MLFSFAKYTGCGNDFLLFDNRGSDFPLSQPTIIERLCHRQWGIGADGVILLERPIQADFRIRIFNSNGSEPEMCGNGLRCLIQWLADCGIGLTSYRIEIMQRILTGFKLENAICIEMGSPKNVQWNIPLQYENQQLHVHHLDTGVPHTVFFTDHVDPVNLIELGSYIRHHSLWKPKGTNVTIAEQVGDQTLKIRTYERGVEGETLACGTGAVAAALAAAYYYHLSSPLTIQTRSGEELSIGFFQQQEDFSHVTLTGQARHIFKGEVCLSKAPYMDE